MLHTAHRCPASRRTARWCGSWRRPVCLPVCRSGRALDRNLLQGRAGAALADRPTEQQQQPAGPAPALCPARLRSHSRRSHTGTDVLFWTVLGWDVLFGTVLGWDVLVWVVLSCDVLCCALLRRFMSYCAALREHALRN